MRPRIAIVGAGPAGLYCVQHLLAPFAPEVEIDLFERLPTPGGLVRYGVAPDHPEKKRIGEHLFRLLLARPEVRLFGNVAVGRDVAAAELREWYDAVIYANGAEGDAQLGIPGEDLPGSFAARDFILWYNGHPDKSHLRFDFGFERAVVIGNGNVALDVARILALPHDALARTDIAPRALAALRQNQIREVVIAARRGWAQSAFNAPEWEELLHMEDVEIGFDGMAPEEALDGPETGFSQRLKNAVFRKMQARAKAPARCRILLQYLSSPLEIAGEGKVERVRFARNRVVDGGRIEGTGEGFAVQAGLVLRAAGFRGQAMPGVPFDAMRGVIPNWHGRVMETDAVLPGVYVTGWIKRGPSGIIGTNKKCARQTVDALQEDLAALPKKARPAGWVEAELRRRRPEMTGLEGWLAIDRAEKRAGFAAGAPRVKCEHLEAMLNHALQLEFA